MKKLLIILLGIIALAGCHESPKCVIEGAVSDSGLNGRRIFLVPVYYEDSLGVDSVVIKDNRFHFERNEEYLADIRVDYHYRQGTENLLVITEPGEVKVLIDSVSIGGGTPQNDLLQLWKELLMNRNKELKTLNHEYSSLLKSGDTTNAEIIKKNMEDVIDRFNSRTKDMVVGLRTGTLHDFLETRLPKEK